MSVPDYNGGGIVNLMASISAGLGGAGAAVTNDESEYPVHPKVPPAMLAESRHVVLLIIDGLGYEFLRRRLPNGALAAGLEGSVTSVFPSTTTTAITTYLTADAPQQHGLTGWFMWLKEIGVVATPLPFRSRSGNKQLGSFGYPSSALFDRPCVFDRVARDCYMAQPAALSESAYSRAHTGRASVKPFRSLKAMFGCIRKLSARSRPSFTYAYWPDLDTLGHRHGMESGAAVSHLEEIDRGVGALIDGIRGRGVTLLVVADHGFIDTDAQSWVDLADHPELEATLAMPLCGEPRAAYCYVRPGRRDDFEAYVRERLSAACELHESGDLLRGGYFGSGKPHPRLGARIGDYCLIMKENFAIREHLATERRDKVMVGVHGGLSSAEMHVPLIVHAP